MGEEHNSRFRELMAAAASHLAIDMAEDEVADPIAFTFEDMQVLLTLDERGDDHAVIFSVSFGVVPAARELELYREFLDANLFWAGTNGATIGVDTGTGEALLCLRVPLADLDGVQVAAISAEMIEMGLVWRQVLDPTREDIAPAPDHTAIRV